jgi:HD-GYP domain-containing protein (c-di-GMP phosphodiesterase class II)
LAHRPITTVTTDDHGRLPAPVVDWPISQESFDRLTRQWRGWPVWLSLWNRQGQNVTFDSQGPRLWATLWSRGRHFRQQLGAFARDSLEARTSPPKQGSDRRRNLGPWWPSLGLIAVPVRWRQRTVGIVLGAVVLPNRDSEEFARLCAQCELDQQAAADLAARAYPVGEDQVEHLDRLLTSTVEQLREIEVAGQETTILTENLQNTYEELNLVYQISALMHLPQKPSQMCQRVGREVLEVSRASAVGVVLSEYNLPNTSAGQSAEYPSQPLSDRVIQVGQGAPSLGELDRLAESIDIDVSAHPGHLLLNRACQRPEFEWAHPWLQHLVALPLWHEQQLLGVLLAINCDDPGDFTSVDVQLFRAVADRVTAFLENQRLYDGVADLLMGLLHAMVNSIDAKDPYTCGHSERVAFISRALAQEANLSPVECERVYLAGLLHDVGKLGVPDAILCKPGKLTVEEFDAMRKHPEVGARILARVRQIADLVPGVLHHHERADGRGYPHRLPGKEIPLLGRIICLADCFDAMTTSRTYRVALPLPVALAEIRRCSGTQFDPELAEMFLRLDPQRLSKESRECAGVEPTISHVGALNAVVGGRLDPAGASPRNLRRPGGA